MPVSPQQARAVAEKIFSFLPGSRPPTADEVTLAGQKIVDTPGVDNWDAMEAQLAAKFHVDAKPITPEQREEFITRLIPYIQKAPEHKGMGIQYTGAHYDTLAILNSMGLEGDKLIANTPMGRNAMSVVFSPEGKITIEGKPLVPAAGADDDWSKDPRNTSGYRANIRRDPK